MNIPDNDSSPPVQRPQFSVLNLIALITVSALILSAVVINKRAKNEKRRLQKQVSTLEQENKDLEYQLYNARGQGVRTSYAEKILFHISANIEKHPKLQQRLADYEQRKIGISVNQLSDEDNLSCVNLYSLEGNRSSTPFCHKFLVEEEPFQVLASISGEQSRTARFHEGKWVCGAGKNGRDQWYIIDKTGFTEYMPEE